MPERHFDAAYYQRFYENPDTRVADAEDIGRLGHFVGAYLRYLELPVRRVLDMGCGMGLWRPVINALFPEATYTGVEISAHLCKTLGYTRGSAVDYVGRGQYDLVICQGVLQYLSNGDAKKALANLARLCRGVLYLEALTQEDWDHNCDQQRTDGDVFLRPAAFYRQRLARPFVALGGGLFLARQAPVTLYELEKLK